MTRPRQKHDVLTSHTERSTTMQMTAPTTAIGAEGDLLERTGDGEPMAARAASLTLDGLTKRFGKAAAVDGVSLHVPAGSFLVLLGPSGCGKSTTLRMLAGLEDPSAGEIRFGERVIVRGTGSSVPASRRNAGLVFQSYALWPHKTVAQNVEWPLAVAKVPRRRREERVAQVLELLGIAALASRYPGEISGGQQQRTAIARMIAPEPEVLLFDEPLSNLDAKLRVETRSELMRIHRATGATSVYVTHDQVEAMTMATHIALMRDGRIEQFGTPRELVEEPATAFAATFMGTPPANVIDGSVHDGRLVLAGVDVGMAPHGVGGRVRALYRSGSLTLAEPGERGPVLVGTLVDQVPMAERWVIGIDVAGGTRVHVTADAPCEARVGERVGVRLPDAPEACFDEAGDRLTGCDPRNLQTRRADR